MPAKCIFLPRLDLSTGETSILKVICLKDDSKAEAKSAPTNHLMNNAELREYLNHGVPQFQTIAEITQNNPFEVPAFRTLLPAQLGIETPPKTVTMELSINHENLFGEYVELG